MKNRIATMLSAAVATALLSAVAAAGSGAAANGRAPPFTLEARGGSKISLAQYKGQVVMLNFWASWCGPCRQEMPLLENIYKKYNKLGFTLIGVNVEPDSKDAEGFLKQTPVSFPVIYDKDSTVSKAYDVQGMPSTVIIDRKGNIRVLHRGYKPGDENEYLDSIRSLVRE
jgi:peroxiredoxin